MQTKYKHRDCFLARNQENGLESVCNPINQVSTQHFLFPVFVHHTENTYTGMIQDMARYMTCKYVFPT